MIGKMELELDGTKQQGSVRSGVTIRLNKHVTDMLEIQPAVPCQSLRISLRCFGAIWKEKVLGCYTRYVESLRPFGLRHKIRCGIVSRVVHSGFASLHRWLVCISRRA